MKTVAERPLAGGYDFIVVGSGAAGLVGAISARLAGLRPLIIEKSDHWGGTTAMSGGVLWIPANDAMAGEGVDDPVERARTYLAGLLGPAALWARKGSRGHRGLGYAWVTVMIGTAGSPPTFSSWMFMPSPRISLQSTSKTTGIPACSVFVPLTMDS